MRETIGVQLNNDEPFVLERSGPDNSINPRCVEVYSSDVSENQCKGISCKVVSPIVRFNCEYPPFFALYGCFILEYYILPYLISF